MSDSDAPPPPTARRSRKDRLIQTRVPRQLEVTLKREASRRRLTVSHLIRSVLEDAFELVDGVVADVDQIVSDSVHLARNVRRNARRLASPRLPPPARPDAAAEDELDLVYAWNELVLQRPVVCSGCGATIERGERGFAGLSDEPQAPRTWLCSPCVGHLQARAPR